MTVEERFQILLTGTYRPVLVRVSICPIRSVAFRSRLGAMVLENQVTVDAYRLMRGMRKAVLGQSASHEGSQVELIEGGERLW